MFTFSTAICKKYDVLAGYLALVVFTKLMYPNKSFVSEKFEKCDFWQCLYQKAPLVKKSRDFMTSLVYGLQTIIER